MPGFSRHFTLHHDVVVGDDYALRILPQAGCQPLHKFTLAGLQQRRDRSRHFHLAVANQRRVGAHRFHESACRQDIAFRIDNVAPPRFQQEFLPGVIARFGAEFLIAQNLKIDESVPQADKGRAQQ